MKYTSYWELNQLAGGGGEDGKNRTKSVKYTSYWELNQLAVGGERMKRTARSRA